MALVNLGQHLFQNCSLPSSKKEHNLTGILINEAMGQLEHFYKYYDSTRAYRNHRNTEVPK